MKKIYRTLLKKIQYYFIKLLNLIFHRSNYKIIPSIDELKNFNFDYSEDNRRLVLKNNKNKIDKIVIDTTLFKSHLCDIGSKFNTNKSPYNLNGHRSGYTGIYFLIFNNLRDKKFNFAEIGIEKNGSSKLWREFFSNANLYLFEKDTHKIEQAKKDQLKDSYYYEIDVDINEKIKSAFQKTGKKFDIIIDDSTHHFDHQINIINNVKDYLNPGGILVIEDIFRFRKDHTEERYFNEISKISAEFSKIFFIESLHTNNFTASWNCEKLLVLIKK